MMPLWTLRCMYLSELTFLFSLDIYLRMELLDRILSPVLVLWGNLHTVAIPIYIPTTVYKVHFSPHPPSNVLSVIFSMVGILTVVCYTTLCMCLLLFTGAQLLDSVVSAFAVQPGGSAVCLHTAPLLWISVPSRAPQSTESGSLDYPVDSHWLSSLYIVSIVYIC